MTIETKIALQLGAAIIERCTKEQMLEMAQEELLAVYNDIASNEEIAKEICKVNGKFKEYYIREAGGSVS